MSDGIEIDGTVKDVFLSEVMNKYCYNIVDFTKYFFSGIKGIMYYDAFGTARINAIDQGHLIKNLIGCGWKYICHEVEMMVDRPTFNNVTKLTMSVDVDRFPVITCRGSEYFVSVNKSSIDEIAKRFTKSRFHCDESIPSDISYEIKRKWINNIFDKKRAEDTLIYREDSDSMDLMGFVCITKGGIIDLIGTAHKINNKGIAELLVSRALKYYDQLVAKTQLNNKKAIDFYYRVGFQPINYYMVFHKYD